MNSGVSGEIESGEVAVNDVFPKNDFFDGWNDKARVERQASTVRFQRVVRVFHEVLSCVTLSR